MEQVDRRTLPRQETSNMQTHASDRSNAARFPNSSFKPIHHLCLCVACFLSRCFVVMFSRGPAPIAPNPKEAYFSAPRVETRVTEKNATRGRDSSLLVTTKLFNFELRVAVCVYRIYFCQTKIHAVPRAVGCKAP